MYASLKDQVPDSRKDTPTTHLVAATLAGFVSNTLGCPVWTVKTRLMLQASPTNANQSNGSNSMRYSGIRECVRQIYNENGTRTFFRGLSASYWGVSEMAVQFLLYEQMRPVARDFGVAQHKRGSTTSSLGDGERIHPVRLLVAASVSKVLAILLTYPHE